MVKHRDPIGKPIHGIAPPVCDALSLATRRSSIVSAASCLAQQEEEPVVLAVVSTMDEAKQVKLEERQVKRSLIEITKKV